MLWRRYTFFRAELEAIVRNSWPVLGIMLLNFVVGYTDVYVAGRLGHDAQAIVGLANQIYFLSIIVGNAMAVGTVSLVSRSFGKDDPHEVRSWISQGVVLCTVMGAVVSLSVLLFAPPIVAAFRIPQEMRGEAVVFLRTLALAIGPNYLVIVGSAVLRAVSKPQRAFLTMAISAVFNVPGDVILALGWGPIPAMGVVGIAWSTGGALSCSAGYAMFLMVREAGFQWGGTPLFSFSRRRLATLSHISWPSAVLQLAFQGGTLVLYRYLAMLGDKSGMVAMAAYTNGIRIESILFLPAFAVHMAVAVLVGQSLGRGSLVEARRVAYTAVLFAIVVLSPVAVWLFWQAPTAALWLSRHPEVCAETVRYIRINTAFYPLLIASIVFGGAIQGAGDTRGAMWIIIAAVWGVRVPLAGILCLALQWGAQGVWWAMGCSMTVQALSMMIRFRSSAWHRTVL